MPDYTMPAAGTFCWVELHTNDVAAARAFYSAIFGWTISDAPGPAPYSLASLDGRLTAGFVELPPSTFTNDATPHWLSYVAVDNVAESAGRVASLGGTVLVPPATMEPGTMSVFRDPVGGVLALWDGTEPIGASLDGELGAFGWNELITSNLETAKRFYTSLFGWSGESIPMPNVGYVLLKQAGVDIGGIMSFPEDAPIPPLGWCVYFVVADADAVFRKSVALGAQVALPLKDVPTVGRFGFLRDPQGATFAVIRLEARAA